MQRFPPPNHQAPTFPGGGWKLSELATLLRFGATQSQKLSGVPKKNRGTLLEHPSPNKSKNEVGLNSGSGKIQHSVPFWLPLEESRFSCPNAPEEEKNG